MATITAASPKECKAEQWDVVVPANGVAAGFTAGSWRDHRLIVREPRDADVQETANQQTEGKRKHWKNNVNPHSSSIGAGAVEDLPRSLVRWICRPS